MRSTPMVASALMLIGATAAMAQTPQSETPNQGVITVDGITFETWRDYTSSDIFRERGLRCGYVSDGLGLRGDPSDCTFSLTNPAAEYDPTVVKYEIPVVVHVIRQNDGVTGNVSPAMVQSQIDILNEDFLALTGTPGANGTNIQIEFFLATEDPGGNPSTGITYSNNTTWYNDGGNYWDSLAWDTNRYLNIYTNSASGALGYVPNLPQGGIAGTNADRVVVLWSSFGRNGPIGAPFDQGRTATHEVGHYLGLEHTFTGGCAGGNCYTTGDLICDTNDQQAPTSGCGGSSCGNANPFDNYMDYSDDTCMERFTPEQARRMRCSLENYRPALALIGNDDCNNNGTPDSDDIANGTSEDCNNNGRPDECENLSDCNGNGTADLCEGLVDCNNNGTPDECESLEDCNNNGTPDECEQLPDCNQNGIPDECDLALGTSDDCNNNLTPDECEGIVNSSYPTAANLAIPDNSTTGVDSVLNIPESRIIADLDLEIEIDHGWTGDLVVRLNHDGVGGRVIARPGFPDSTFGFDDAGFDVTLDDDASTSIETASAGGGVVTGSFQPDPYALSNFNGMDAGGDWTLTVEDRESGFTGTLLNWTLNITELGDPVDCDECPGDFNGDGTIDLTDLSTLLANFGATGAAASDGDTDGDGDVDLTDLSYVLSNFGGGCP